MRLRFWVICAVLLAQTAWGQQAPAAAATAPGSAVGTFTADGKTVPLRHAYALVKPDSFDENKDAIYIFLTDVEVTPEMLRDDYGLFEPWRAGKLNAVEVRLDESKSPRAGQLYHQGFDGESLSVSGMMKFDLQHFDGKRISGRLYTEPEESFGKKWQFSARFTADIQPKPQPAPETTAPLDSPPAKLGLAFFKAAQAKDKAAIKKLSTPEVAAELDGPHGEQMMEMLPMVFSPGLKLTKVVMKGDDHAEIIFSSKTKDSSETATIKAVLLDGVWLMSK
jgi:hypothetical protein